MDLPAGSFPKVASEHLFDQCGARKFRVGQLIDLSEEIG